MKVEMIQVPREIQEEPGFMPARIARLGEPRSVIRKHMCSDVCPGVCSALMEIFPTLLRSCRCEPAPG